VKYINLIIISQYLSKTSVDLNPHSSNYKKGFAGSSLRKNTEIKIKYYRFTELELIFTILHYLKKCIFTQKHI